jgi:hypothetical protein
MRLVKEYINEKFTEETDPIEDLGIGLIDKLNKKILNLRTYTIFKIYGEKINITKDGRKFMIKFKYLHFQKWTQFEKWFNTMISTEGLDKYLMFPPKRKRNIYMSSKYLVYSVKEDYWSLFKKLKTK